jgi:hypothetical protein
LRVGRGLVLHRAAMNGRPNAQGQSGRASLCATGQAVDCWATAILPPPQSKADLWSADREVGRLSAARRPEIGPEDGRIITPASSPSASPRLCRHHGARVAQAGANVEKEFRAACPRSRQRPRNCGRTKADEENEMLISLAPPAPQGVVASAPACCAGALVPPRARDGRTVFSDEEYGR